MTLKITQIRWQLLVAVATLAVLLLLFFKAKPVDPEIYNQVAGDLAELQTRDIELGEAVLQLHYRLENNYDSVSELMQRIKYLEVELAQFQQNGLLPDSPEIHQEFDSLHQRIIKKEMQLNDFKTNNSISKISLIYLSRMTAEVLALLPKSNEVLLEKFEFLLRDALLESLNGEVNSVGILEADILKVEQLAAILPNNVQNLALHIARHASSLMQAEKVMPDLLNELSSHSTVRLGVVLDKLYQDYYQAQQRSSAIYRLFLLLAAMLMFGYSSYVYFRLKSQRQQLRRALADIGNQQMALNEHAIVGITNVKGEIIYANDKFLAISGYSAEELQGKSHRLLKSGEHDQAFYRELWDTVTSGHVWHGEIKNRAKDGRFYWVESTIVPFMDESGKPYQYVSIRTDITAHKKLRVQGTRERRVLQNVMDTLGEGVFMLDDEGNCTYLNREAEAIVGWASEEIVGRNWHEFIHSQLLDGTLVAQVDSPLRICTQANEVYRSEADYFRNKNGTLFPISIVASPMLEGEQVTGLVAAFQDISERKFFERELLRAKESAEAANRAKGDFLATMSHEIRTPMNGIIGMTELTLGTQLDAEQHEYLSMVKLSADSLLTIINDILDFSKIESGKMALELVEFDIRNLFARTEKALALRAEQQGIELVYAVDAEIQDLLVGDAGRLRQVLTNLLGNAIKFSERGAVELRMKLLQKLDNTLRVCIEVADQGIGITAEQKMHIFDAFTQADASTTRKYGGTGLGLAISSQLVGAMGGELSVESELGVGSVFSFVIDLPLGNASVLQSAELAGLSVLVVDDNATNRQYLMQLLRQFGATANAAANETEAMAKLDKAQSAGHAFDVLLLDAKMQNSEGFNFATVVKSKAKTTRGLVMMLSSIRLHEDIDRCRNMGVSAYVSKPIEKNELLNAIKQVLGATAKIVPIPSQSKPPSPLCLTILLAEDNLVNQKLATAVLKKRGHHVVLANNGIEAVEISCKRNFDVILMDMQMPEMGGLEATEFIRLYEAELARHTPIIAMTANAMPEDRQRCLDAGMDEYLTKPLDFEKLNALLQGLPVDALASLVQPPFIPVTAFDHAQALQGADAWVVKTIGDVFLLECDGKMLAMRAAIEAADKELLIRAAHTLRGSVGYFNAQPVVEIAAQLESSAVQADVAQLYVLYRKLYTEVNLLKVSLAVYLENSRGHNN